MKNTEFPDIKTDSVSVMEKVGKNKEINLNLDDILNENENKMDILFIFLRPREVMQVLHSRDGITRAGLIFAGLVAFLWLAPAFSSVPTKK